MRKIKHKLEEAIEGLRKAKEKKGGFLGFIRDAVNTFSSVFFLLNLFVIWLLKPLDWLQNL
ncbi:hypothetical protein JP0109_01840 [Helicobacter pylori]|nr:putative uncharacterized protein [Helicobacter pylori]BCJ03444.1 hypothetical protein JSHR6_13390 [Helicobacter pylori]GHR62633.1 hypothetical protein JP0103_04760 [Helicobacter pylori]GHR84634.1 hypothetical protein JP0109_01840 [Helicobacter pylori]